jgi:excisionase family DNA binding protein
MRMTPREAARYLGCSVAMIYSLCSKKRLAHYRVGQGRGKIVISKQDADDYLQSVRVEIQGACPSPTPTRQPILRLKHLKV